MKTSRLLILLRHYAPVISFVLVFLYVFRKVVFMGLLPFPGDLLVSFFFPYSSGGWEGFVEFVAHKEFIASDVVRQIFPWRILAMDQLREGSIPLWNPYAFSGTPLIANLQSAVFYPVNILFFVLPDVTAWVTYVLLQPFLAFCGMYLFIRSLGLTRWAACMAGIFFAFISYTMIWFELGVVGHTALWLPYTLFGLTKWSTQKKPMYLLLTAFAVGCSILAGHAQTAVYLLLTSCAYYVFVSPSKSVVGLLKQSWWIILGVCLAGIQLIPTLELLSLSARNAETSKEVFYRMQLPFQHLVMFFIPDYFGNPAVNNFWGADYNEFISFVGVVSLLFMVVGLYTYKHNKTVLFFVGLSLTALVFALPTPLSNMLQILQIPVLGTGIPARAVFLLQFSAVVLAAFGIEAYVTKKKLSLIPIGIAVGLYAAIWLVTGILTFTTTDPTFAAHLRVSIRNMILPTGIAIAVGGLLIVSRFMPSKKVIVLVICIVLAGFEYGYMFSKYLPFSPSSFVFPRHPLVTKLQEMPPATRFYGYESANVSANFPTAWRVQSPEGYDPLYIKTYGELFYAVEKGSYDPLIPRSDARFVPSTPKTDPQTKRLLLNLLGVSVIVDSQHRSMFPDAPDAGKFPTERFHFFWQKDIWKMYSNTEALPRAAVFYDYEVQTDDQSGLRRLVSAQFPYRTRLVVHERPTFTPERLPITPADITRYTANEVTIRAKAIRPGLVFLSDAYYPGWNAYVDGVKQPMYRSDIALRSVPVPAGEHTVIMKYEPLSFLIGAIMTIGSLLVSAIIYLKLRRVSGNHEKKHTKK